MRVLSLGFEVSGWIDPKRNWHLSSWELKAECRLNIARTFQAPCVWEGAGIVK